MHGARLNAAAAADAGRVLGDLVLIRGERQHRARALGHGEVGGGLRHTHHRAAGDELERLVLLIGDTIKIAADLEIKAVTLGIMIGKAVKLAEGNLDTHSKQVTMNKDFLREVALSAGCGGETLAVIEKITLARELWTLLSAEDLQAFCSRLLELCHQYCDPLLPEGELTILLISEEGKIIT